MPFSNRLFLGEAHYADLRVRKDRSGYHAMIHASRFLAGKRIMSGYASVVTADWSRHLASGLAPDDISGGEDVRNIRPQIVVYDDFPAAVSPYPCSFNGHLIGVRPAASRHKQLFRPKLLLATVDRGRDDRPSVFLPHSPDLRLRHDVNPFRLEYPPDFLPHFRLVAMRKQLFVPLQNRYFASEAAEHLTEFQSDVPASDDYQRFRQLGQLRVFIGGQQVTRDVWHLVQTLDFGDNGTRAGRDQYFLARKPLAVHLDRMGITELDVPLFYADAASNQALVLLLSITMDHFILLPNEGSEIQPHFCRRETWVARMGGLVDDPRSFYQILGWQAASVSTGPADNAFLGHDRCLAKLCRAQRRRECRRARTEDHQIKMRRVCRTTVGHAALLIIKSLPVASRLLWPWIRNFRFIAGVPHRYDQLAGVGLRRVELHRCRASRIVHLGVHDSRSLE